MLYWLCLYVQQRANIYRLRESSTNRRFRTNSTLIYIYNYICSVKRRSSCIHSSRWIALLWLFFPFLFFSFLFFSFPFSSILVRPRRRKTVIFMHLGGRVRRIKNRFTRCWPSLWSCPSWPCSRNSLWPWLVAPVLARRTRDTGCPICAPVSWRRIRNIDWNGTKET